MSTSFDFRQPGRVVLGSIGPPGQRVFYLQARQDDVLISLKLEKHQVAFLTGGLREVLADLAATSPDSTDEVAQELEEPLQEEWAVGALELAYDPAGDRIVLVAAEAGELDEAEEDDEPDASPLPLPNGSEEGPAGGVARMSITRQQAATMIEEGKRLLRAGRPPCPLCGFPLTEDHSCPKTNGHRAPSL